MSHSYTKQLIHIVWSTASQQHSLSRDIKNQLYAYIATLIKSKNGKLFCCGGNVDHIHILVLLPADISLSDFIRHIKAYSSKWIKILPQVDPQFSWQTGYAAFSIQEDKINDVCQYIRSDEERHQTSKKSYAEELESLLKRQGIFFKEEYFLNNSFSKIYVHVIWSTYNRTPDLDKNIRDDLYADIKATIAQNNGKTHAIGGVEDHIHVLIEAPKNKALSDLIQETKAKSTHFLKNTGNEKFRYFRWQTGYGAFSLSLSCLENIKSYIEQQEEHHCNRNPLDEWNEFLIRNGVLK